jgi:hypothetical protein
MSLLFFRRPRIVCDGVVLNVLPHEVTNNLSGGTILRPTHFDELISKVSLHSNAKSGVLTRHGQSVSNVITKGKSKPKIVESKITNLII